MAYGSAMFLLNCTNADGSCSTTDFEIKPAVTTRNLTQSEIAAFDIHPYSCTVASFLSPYWEIRDWSVTRFWTESQDWKPYHFETMVKFQLFNSFMQNSTLSAPRSCSIGGDRLRSFMSGQWSDCVTPQPFRWMRFAFNNVTNVLSLNQSWTCDDKNSDHP
jgi:hypothetical protein